MTERLHTCTGERGTVACEACADTIAGPGEAAAVMPTFPNATAGASALPIGRVWTGVVQTSADAIRLAGGVLPTACAAPPQFHALPPQQPCPTCGQLMAVMLMSVGLDYGANSATHSCSWCDDPRTKALRDTARREALLEAKAAIESEWAKRERDSGFYGSPADKALRNVRLAVCALIDDPATVERVTAQGVTARGGG